MRQRLRKISKLMVANRGEIAIRVLRAASELKIPTVAVYTYEDRYSLHRYKADEAYQIGENDEPLKPYLDMDEIISTARKNGVDAIHPGYGFLSENVEFVKKCGQAGITFIGPEPGVMERLGDKVEAKKTARKARVPVIEDSVRDLVSVEVAISEAGKIGYPVMIKAAAGGGGRGMRVVRTEEELRKAYAEARGEAGKAFGNETVFLEKFIDNPKHIEVQILGDNYGNLVHLFERDCSVQRRFQKLVEIAPSMTLSRDTRNALYDYALAIARSVNYNNAGTVEFLVDGDENIYFIEVNPRIQVEHTITEEITGIDIVRSQILVAQGYSLSSKPLLIKNQKNIKTNGYAIQCRITTENPANDFTPDYGTVIAYRSAGGYGIRLDAGNCYAGVTISPFFDSLLVKVSARGRTLKGASERLTRALSEFRIRGVETNISFLQNVINQPIFYEGEATVNFINDHPELFDMPRRLNRGTKLLSYLGEIAVNGHPDIENADHGRKFHHPKIPPFRRRDDFPEGSRDLLGKLGREDFVDWLKNEKQIHFTDTTFRDAHQSLLATRVRTIDMLRVAESFAKNHPNVFSVEMWGGATFDVAMRFLHENPWERLRNLREAMPNLLMQMLLRGSNAVGYKAYPDNLIERFIVRAWENGIDLFRIFDSLNWVDAMQVSIRTVREETGALAEASICYTGDLQNADSKYTLDYYLDLAKRLEDEGAHILAIKDMAGLLKPRSAGLLVSELKNTVNIPIHLHTHDTSSLQSATYLEAVDAGVDVIDCALASMSGLTSQPNFNSMVAALQGHEREQPFDLKSLNRFAGYWENVREYYYPFESGLKAGTAEVYEHEIPGGQYSNLRPQAIALGLGERFDEVKQNYADVNELFGDIIKVTPTSKVVGDMALYLTSNGMTASEVLVRGNSISFPDSVISFFKGELGQPYGGFPAELSKIVLKGEKPFTDRPNAHLQPVDFDTEFAEFRHEFSEYCDEMDFLSFKLYPKVFREYYKHRELYGEVWRLPTPAFFYGLENNEEIFVEIARGKSLIIKMLQRSEPDEDGFCNVFFEMNGQTRILRIRDRGFKVARPVHLKAEGPGHVGALLQGRLSDILVKEGDSVRENTPLFVIEAMKMETTVSAPRAGKIKSIVLATGEMVDQDDLVIELE